MSDEPEVLFAVDRGVGRITLNQPKILNAFSFNMVRAIDPKLRAWADDPDIREVVITGAGDRAFCAGGDVRGLHEYSDNREKRLAHAADFFRAEYTLNRLISSYASRSLFRTCINALNARSAFSTAVKTPEKFSVLP